MWDNILGAWLNVRPELIKTDATNSAEILRQPLFGNPSILNSNGSPLEISNLREGNAFAPQAALESRTSETQQTRSGKVLLR